MDDLHEFVQGQFAQFAGHDAYEAQISIWCFMQRSESAERSRDWRHANREHARAYDAARRPPKPRRVVAENECYQCTLPAVPGRKSCEKHLAADRARALKRPTTRAARAARSRQQESRAA